jgi:hypothetical protein
MKSYANDLKTFHNSQSYSACLRGDLSSKIVATGDSNPVFYPNPVLKGGEIHIHYPKGIIELKLMDAQGKILRSETLSEVEDYELLMDNDLETGLYLITIKDKEGRASTFKIRVD